MALAVLVGAIWTATSPAGRLLSPARHSVAEARTRTNTIIAGSFRNAAGQPLRAWVWLSLPRPGNAAGQSVTLAKARADMKGRFTLPTISGAIFRKADIRNAAIRNGGWINLELLAGVGHLYVYRSVPRKYVPARQALLAFGRQSRPTIVIARGAPGVGLSHKTLPAIVSGRGQIGPLCFDASSSIVAEADRSTTIGELHTADAQTATFTYGTSADSDIGVGFNVPGTTRWSIGGEAHVGNSVTSSSTWQVGAVFNHRLLTNFHYVKRKTYNTCLGTRYTIKATGVGGCGDVVVRMSCSLVSATRTLLFGGLTVAE